jgi:hypothetical protein
MRRRSEPHTFEQRLVAQRQRLEHELARLPDGMERDSLTTRIEQLQAAAEMYDFLMLREEAAAPRGSGSALGLLVTRGDAKLPPQPPR